MAGKKKLDPRLDEVGLSALFQERLKIIIEAAGGPTEAAKQISASRDAVWKWSEGRARPPFFELAQLCHITGRSLDWLAGFDAQSVNVRTDLLEQSVLLVEQWLTEHKRALAPEKKSQAVVLIYQMFADVPESGKIEVSAQRVHQILRLVA